MWQPLVLAADDESAIRRLIKISLPSEGYAVLTAANGQEALELAKKRRPDVLVLDVAMPDMSGYDVLRQLTQDGETIPTIFLTGHASHTDIADALDMGADDYLVKPFGTAELSARIKAVLRRTRRQFTDRHVLTLNNCSIDLDQWVVSNDGGEVPLTRLEWRLLRAMVLQPGKVFLRSELLSAVWGPEFRDDLDYLRILVSRLRRKLGDTRQASAMIRTVPGVGYMLAVAD